MEGDAMLTDARRESISLLHREAKDQVLDGNVDKLREIIHGSNYISELLEFRDNCRYTLLQTAVLQHKTEVVRYLLDVGVDVDAPICGKPLHLAASLGHCDILYLLLKYGADYSSLSAVCRPNGHDYVATYYDPLKEEWVESCRGDVQTKRTAHHFHNTIFYAVKADSVDCLEELVAQIHRSGRAIEELEPELLHIACALGSMNCLKFLCKRCNYELNALDSHGYGVIHYGVNWGIEMIDFLLAQDAQLDNLTKEGQSIIHVLMTLTCPLNMTHTAQTMQYLDSLGRNYPVNPTLIDSIGGLAIDIFLSYLNLNVSSHLTQHEIYKGLKIPPGMVKHCEATFESEYLTCFSILLKWHRTAGPVDEDVAYDRRYSCHNPMDNFFTRCLYCQMLPSYAANYVALPRSPLLLDYEKDYIRKLGSSIQENQNSFAQVLPSVVTEEVHCNHYYTDLVLNIHMYSKVLQMVSATGEEHAIWCQNNCLKYLMEQVSINESVVQGSDFDILKHCVTLLHASGHESWSDSDAVDLLACRLYEIQVGSLNVDLFPSAVADGIIKIMDLLLGYGCGYLPDVVRTFLRIIARDFHRPTWDVRLLRRLLAVIIKHGGAPALVAVTWATPSSFSQYQPNPANNSTSVKYIQEVTLFHEELYEVLMALDQRSAHAIFLDFIRMAVETNRSLDDYPFLKAYKEGLCCRTLRSQARAVVCKSLGWKFDRDLQSLSIPRVLVSYIKFETE